MAQEYGVGDDGVRSRGGIDRLKSSICQASLFIHPTFVAQGSSSFQIPYHVRRRVIHAAIPKFQHLWWRHWTLRQVDWWIDEGDAWKRAD